jgi:hypothetical protein
MFVHPFISLLSGMMQASVNSGKAGIMFLFLVKATNVRVSPWSGEFSLKTSGAPPT